MLFISTSFLHGFQVACKCFSTAVTKQLSIAIKREGDEIPQGYVAHNNRAIGDLQSQLLCSVASYAKLS